MHEIPSVNELWAAGLGLLLAVGCGAVTEGRSIGSETHFLARCTAECGGGLECIEGICTLACSGDRECSALHATASCAPATSSSGVASCRVRCDAESECVSQDESWSCEASRCVSPPASLAVRSEPSRERCPTFEGGVAAPIEVEASFERVPGSSNVEWAHADDDGVYWSDYDGGIYAVRRGERSAITLRSAPSVPLSYSGLMSDANRIYWTEATPYSASFEPGPPSPPGRVMSMAKSGGTPEVLAESASVTLTSLGVDASGQVFVTGSDGYVNEVSSSGALERMTSVPQDYRELQLVDGLLYWARYDDDDATQTLLFVATPGAGAPERVARVQNTSGLPSFVAGRGVVLWTAQETRLEPSTPSQHFVMFNQNTGCVQELPSAELSIEQKLLDARHVYWQSFDALEAVSPGPDLAAAPILRVNLRTGRFERVVTPGLDSTINTDLIAQDATTLYIRHGSDVALFAVRKPD